MKHYFMIISLLTAVLLTACKENTSPSEDDFVSIHTELREIGMSSAIIDLKTNSGDEYAYILSPLSEISNEGNITASEIFEKGSIGKFQDYAAEVLLENLNRETSYILYAAARRMGESPIYTPDSEISITEFRTSGYTETITLNDVDYTSYSYHIEVPEGKTYKHISVRKVDFDWIVSMVDGTETSYTSAFGFTIDQSGDFDYDRYFVDVYNGPVNIYPDDTYLIIATEVDAEGKGIESTTESIIVKTPKPAESPFNIDINVSDITSTAATVTLVPEDGIVNYRWNVVETKDLEYVAKEGEASVRSLILGEWPNTDRESDQEMKLNISKLLPETSYTVGVIGFDADFGMKQVMYEFKTSEPIGPKPEINIADLHVDSPFTASLVVYLQHAVTATIDIHTKAQYDEVLSRPGVTLDQVVLNNGTALNPEQISAASSEEGLVCQFDSLEPYTTYVFGVYAANDECVAVCDTIQFTTPAQPEYGGEIRKKMPGHYTASILDDQGETITFSVEISRGVNETTEKEYKYKNRLVCLGFGLEDYEYHNPEELISEGWATSEEEANKNYGPKWFIEFLSDGSIATSQLIDYELDYDMMNYNGDRLKFCGYAQKSNGKFIDSFVSFPIEVSEDVNTITIKGYEMYNDWSGETFMYYPSAMKMSSNWSGDAVRIGTSDLVLTRVAEKGRPIAIHLNPGSSENQLIIPQTIDFEYVPLNQHRRFRNRF